MKLPTTTRVQTLILCKDFFTKAKAKKWVKDNNFKYGKLDETKKCYRFRQAEPEEFQPSSFRTIEFRPGVKAVIARPFSNPGKGKTMPKKKKATKKKATKKKATKKKATKKNPPKKKHNPAPNPGKPAELKLEVWPYGKPLDQTKQMYNAWVKAGKIKIHIGMVNARTAKEAKKKAAAYLRKKLK